MTSRKLVSRWRPPGFSGGSKSLISFHCLFVRSVGYLFFRIQCPYRLDGQVVKLSCSKQVQRFSSQLLIRNFSNSFLGLGDSDNATGLARPGVARRLGL